MNLRGLLQKELWSKGTTRKILIGFVVVVVGFAVVFTVEVKWITPGERVAAKQALAELDALQNFDPGNYVESFKKSTEADAMIDTADCAAWTLRDDRVVAALRSYSDWIQFTQTEVQRHRNEGRLQGSITDADRKQDQQADVVNREVGALISGALHKVLN